MRKAFFVLLPPLALACACTAGVGPIGIGPIGEREDPAGGASTRAGSSGQSSGTPSRSGSSGGGTLSCTGSYLCSGGAGAAAPFTADLRQKNDGCEAEVAGDDLLLKSDGTVTQDGEPLGTWQASGTSVIVCAGASNCVTCVPTNGSGGNVDAGTSG